MDPGMIVNNVRLVFGRIKLARSFVISAGGAPSERSFHDQHAHYDASKGGFTPPASVTLRK
jgi:hypothetical protein